MPVQRIAADYLNILVRGGRLSYEARQIPLEMKPKRQKIGYHDDPPSAGRGQLFDGGAQVRLPAFEKRGRPQVKASLCGGGPAHLPNGLIRRFHRRAVRKEDDRGPYRLASITGRHR